MSLLLLNSFSKEIGGKLFVRSVSCAASRLINRLVSAWFWSSEHQLVNAGAGLGIETGPSSLLVHLGQTGTGHSLRDCGIGLMEISLLQNKET